MKMIKILDNNVIHHVSDQSGLPSVILSDHKLSKNTDVFESLAELTRHYTIHTYPEVQPPCKLPIYLQDTVKTELNRLVKTNVIALVTEPTHGFPALWWYRRIITR